MEADRNDLLGLQVFSNHVITAEIFKYLKDYQVPELKKFRLVCLDWYTQSVDGWNEAAWLHVTPDSPAFDYLLDSNRKTEMETRLKKPVYTNFCLKGWDFADCHMRNKEVWNVIQENVQHLRLVDCINQSPTHFNAAVILPLFQNISSLQLIRTDYHRFPSFKPYNLYLTRLEIRGQQYVSYFALRKFINLKEVKISFEECSEFPMGFLFGYLQMFRHSNSTQHALNHVDVMDSPQELSGLAEANLPLKFLTLGLNYSTESPAMDRRRLQSILERYGKRLVTLKLFRFPTTDNPPYPGFPFQVCLTSLVELELWGNMVVNLNFLKFTPLLRKLRMDYYCFERRHLLPKPKNRHPTNRDDIVDRSNVLRNADNFQVPFLQQFIIDRKLKVQSWRFLKAWMPNLLALEAPFDNETFGIVCSQWKNLRGLRLGYGSTVDDDGIAGPLPWTAVPQGIAQLQDLIQLELWMDCGATGQITDKAAEFGFLHLNSLNNLQIFGAQMSPMVMELMKLNIEKLVIMPKCVSGSSEKALCCQWAMHKYNFNSLLTFT